MSVNAIEVESKFTIPEDIDSRVKSLGGRLEKEVSFQDTYHDTPDHRLALNDHWLRNRSGRWQLKHPVVNSAGGTATDIRKYYELEDEEEILLKILPLIGIGADGEEEWLEILVANRCRGFARIETHRQTYMLGTVGLDLDVTDFGYRVGEIEVMVARESDIDAAQLEISEVASKLGLELTSCPGKVEVYLEKHKPQLFERLVQAGILKRY